MNYCLNSCLINSTNFEDMEQRQHKDELYLLAYNLDINVPYNENDGDDNDRNDRDDDNSVDNYINYYIDANMYFLYEIYNRKFITKEILERFDDPNFIALHRYFEHQNNLDNIIKNNTVYDSVEFSKCEEMFVLFVFSINFVTYNGLNYYIKNDINHIYNSNQLKFPLKFSTEHYSDTEVLDDYYPFYNNIFDNYCFWKTDKNENKKISKEFKDTSERLVLFISLSNSKYDIPFDIIMYILVGIPNFLFLHY